jgi:glutaminyl-peptide cyclotransferase
MLYIAFTNFYKMKNFKVLIVIMLSLIITNCVDKNNIKNLFTIDETSFKAMFNNDDSLQLSILNKQNKTIDSVVYFTNDKKIGTSKNNLKFIYKLSNQKLGYQNIKATIYFEGQNTEADTRIEIFSKQEPKILTYTIINTYPHNSESFTQGLEFYNGVLYESTGQKGSSFIKKTDFKTGNILAKVPLDAKYFGEGITFINNQVFQLTWTDFTGFVYDAVTLKQIKSFKYDKQIEGWGLTNDKKHIYQSDGTEKIWKMNPENQKMIDYVNVYTNSSKLVKLNELEWVNGKIYANIWQKDAIIIIDPNTGTVENLVDLSGLRKLAKNKPDDTLNGIAYNPKTNTIFVTGKSWDKMFEIKLSN